jgi:hypothetical protein
MTAPQNDPKRTCAAIAALELDTVLIRTLYRAN